jgi:iron complex transport system substrate-binding protein
VIFTYGMGNEWDTYPKMEEAGLPVILNGDWNEQDPLGRAEWVKFIALFYDKETEANAFFGKVERRYASFVALAASAPKQPRVLVNAPFQGSWTVAGGRSYMARFIADAGGAYLWSDDGSTGGLTLPVETAYARGLLADFWLNPGAAANLAAVKAADPRFADLPAFKSGRVYNNDARANANGANDYFESGSVNPDIVLGDLISVFNPELLPGWKATYYRRLE